MKRIINRSCLMLFAALMFVVTMSSCHPDEPKSPAAKDAKSEAEFVSKKVFGKSVEEAKKALEDAGFVLRTNGYDAPQRANSKLRLDWGEVAYSKSVSDHELEQVYFYTTDGAIKEVLLFWTNSLVDADQQEAYLDRTVMLSKFAENWVKPLGFLSGIIRTWTENGTYVKHYSEDNVGHFTAEKNEYIKNFQEEFAAGLLTKEEYDARIAFIENMYAFWPKEQFYQDVKTPLNGDYEIISEIVSKEACEPEIEGRAAIVSFESRVPADGKPIYNAGIRFFSRSY